MGEWLTRNWPAVAGGIAVLVGAVDAETTMRLGLEWDRGVILAGLGWLGGMAVPALQGRVAAMRVTARLEAARRAAATVDPPPKP